MVAGAERALRKARAGADLYPACLLTDEEILAKLGKATENLEKQEIARFAKFEDAGAMDAGADGRKIWRWRQVMAICRTLRSKGLRMRPVVRRSRSLASKMSKETSTSFRTRRQDVLSERIMLFNSWQDRRDGYRWQSPHGIRSQMYFTPLRSSRRVTQETAEELEWVDQSMIYD